MCATDVEVLFIVTPDFEGGRRLQKVKGFPYLALREERYDSKKLS